FLIVNVLFFKEIFEIFSNLVKKRNEKKREFQFLGEFVKDKWRLMSFDAKLKCLVVFYHMFFPLLISCPVFESKHMMPRGNHKISETLLYNGKGRSRLSNWRQFSLKMILLFFFFSFKK